MQQLFENIEVAQKALDARSAILGDLFVADHLEQIWSQFSPFADHRFIDEIRDALGRIARYDYVCEERTLALHHFHQRYWEAYVGSGLIRRGFRLVPFDNRPQMGPDHLAMTGSGQRLWIECIAPGPGDGPDRVERISDGIVCEVPDDPIKLRLLAAIREKRTKYKRWLENGAVSREDLFVIAINDRSVPGATLDDDPPRIVKALLGAGNYAVDIDRTTGKWSEMYLKPQSEVIKRSGCGVGTNGFRSSEMQEVGAVLYSCIDAWNQAAGNTADFVLLKNPYAQTPLASIQFDGTVEYFIESSENKAQIRSCIHPFSSTE